MLRTTLLATCLPYCTACNHDPKILHTKTKRKPNFLTPDKPPRPDDPQSIIVDSGATIHCINDLSLFTDINLSKQVKLTVADNRTNTYFGVGIVSLPMKAADGSIHNTILHNCVYTPNFEHSLISVRRLWKDNRISTHFGDNNHFKCKHTGNKYSFDFAHNYTLPKSLKISKHEHVFSIVDPATLHSRFGHTSPRRLQKLLSRCTGLPSNAHTMPPHDPTNCDGCQSGGARHKPVPKREDNKFTYFGERISSDLCGPFPKSVDGYTYALCFVDSFTNLLSVYLLTSKASEQVKQAFHDYLRDHKKYMMHGKQIRWHTDNGGEFTSHDLDEFCQEFAVHRSFSTPYEPRQNSHAERMWGILLRPTRIMLSHGFKSCART